MEPKILDEATKWLYDTQMAKVLNSRPFAVGKAEYLLYGVFPAIASRSNTVASLAVDLQTVLDADEKNPLVLLPEDTSFGGLEPPVAFKVVWTYLNGVYSPTGESEIVWPEANMTIEDRYKVIHYIDWFGLNLKLPFVRSYLKLFVDDLVYDLVYASKAPKEVQLARLVEMAFAIRKLIIEVEPELIDRLVAVLPEEQRLNMRYGPLVGVPADYKEILPSPNTRKLEEWQLRGAKDVYAVVYALHKNGVPRYLNTFKVERIATLTSTEITGVKQPRLLIPLPGSSASKVFKPEEISPYGLDSELVTDYFAYRGKYLLVTVINNDAEIGLYQTPLDYWVAPALGITGAPNAPIQYCIVRFFAKELAQHLTGVIPLPPMPGNLPIPAGFQGIAGLPVPLEEYELE